MAAHCLSLDEETNRRLNVLADKRNASRSRLVAELIDKAYIASMEGRDERVQ